MTSTPPEPAAPVRRRRRTRRAAMLSPLAFALAFGAYAGQPGAARVAGREDELPATAATLADAEDAALARLESWLDDWIDPLQG